MSNQRDSIDNVSIAPIPCAVPYQTSREGQRADVCPDSPSPHRAASINERMVRERGQGAECEPTQLCHMTTLLQQHFPDLAQSYHIKALGIFGSYVRNEQTLESDLDILIDFEDITQQSLLTVARLENILSDVLGVKVDLTLYQSLKPTIGKAILKEVVWL